MERNTSSGVITADITYYDNHQVKSVTYGNGTRVGENCRRPRRHDVGMNQPRHDSVPRQLVNTIAAGL